MLTLTERAVGRQRWPRVTAPKVSIVCTTFNHENYVRQALDGFLEQETSFPVEIVLHDDASTDGTRAIVESYERQHKYLFRTIFQIENQYRRHLWPIKIAMATARSEYIAICEGDDYWTDRSKLDEQVALLDANPNASGCFHRADGSFEPAGQVIGGMFGPPGSKLSYRVDDLVESDNFIPTASVVLRRSMCGSLPDWIDTVPHADLAIWTLAASAGPLLFIDKSMSVYRKHPAGLHSRETLGVQALRCVDTLIAIERNIPSAAGEALTRGLRRRLNQIEDQIRLHCATIESLHAAEQNSQLSIQNTMNSRTFRVGLALGRARDRLASLAFRRSTAGQK